MISKRKCLVIDPMHESLFSMLEDIGFGYTYVPDASRAEVKLLLSDHVGLIVRSKTKVDRDLLEGNSSVKFVGRAGAGLDNIDLAFLEERKIQVVHAAEGNRDAVAEHAVGVLLSLIRNIPRADKEVRQGIWKREENRGIEIMGKTVGIIGYGNMGSGFAKRLSGFGCKVLAYDKYKSGFSSEWCEEAAMDRIFSETDILSLHIPLTRETRQLVNEEYLRRFSKAIVLINTARGEIVSLSDLEKMLQQGKVLGAALDVLENEKFDSLTEEQSTILKRLSERTNVIFTPHIAGWTVESHKKINVALIDKIKALVI